MFKKLNKAFLFVVFALSLTKAQDVSIAVGDTAFAGYTDDIIVPIIISNPNSNVGGIQFDLSVSPAMVMLSGVSAIGVASEFSAEYNMVNDGSFRIVFYNAGDPNGLNAGIGSRVINLHFGGSDILSAVLEIKLNNVVVSDANGSLLTSVSTAGDLTIGDVVYLSGSTVTADVEETVEVDFSVLNTGSIGGIQFDIKDTPNYLNLVALATTNRTAGFSLDFNNLNEGASSRLIMYSSDDLNLMPGDGPVIRATFEVVDTAYADSVHLFMENVLATDEIGGSYWIASADSATVIIYPGYIEEPSNLQAIDGQDAHVL